MSLSQDKLMKKLLLFLLFSFPVQAEYLSSYTAVYSHHTNGQMLYKLGKNTQVQVLSKYANWVQIKTIKGKGWVRKNFIQKYAAFSVLGNANANARVHARLRASTDVTAASSRGLAADNNRNKVNSKMIAEGYLRDVERVFVSEKEILEFIGKLK